MRWVLPICVCFIEWWLKIDEEAPTTVVMGCESRSLLKHLQNRVEVKVLPLQARVFIQLHCFQVNETAWQLSQPFFSQLRCNQLLNETLEPDANGTVRACVDFGYTDEFDVERLAKLCCCRGSKFCNEEISWATPGRLLDRQPPTFETSAAASGSAESSIPRTISVALTLFSVLIVFARPC